MDVERFVLDFIFRALLLLCVSNFIKYRIVELHREFF